MIIKHNNSKQLEYNANKLLRVGSKKKIRKERKQKRIPTKYKLYIKSKFWDARKNKFWKKFGKKCVACSDTLYVQLHHTYYKSCNNGREPDEQLVALCVNCHNEFHTIYGTKKNMEKETVEFLLDKVG